MSDVQRVWELIDEIDFCMFVTKTGSTMHGRPMSSIGKRDEGVIYFLTDQRSSKDDEIARENAVYLAYAKGQQHLSVNGTAAISSDRSLIKRLWNPGAQAFWPNGADDPDVVAIVVTPDAAEYWDGPSGIVAGVKMAFAVATGQQPDLGTNAKIAM